MKQFIKELSIKDFIILLIGSGILAFGIYNVHSIADVTEGGALGLTLLLQHWFQISPAISAFVINFACFFLGWRMLGGKFILYSFISGGAYSVFYYIFEQFEPVWPGIADHQLLAAIVGAIFVGVGIGLCVRVGGAPSGDDALAMSLSKAFKTEIQWIYLISDLTVLGLSLTYIPLQRILYSLLTVVLSGQLIGYIDRVGKPKSE